MASEPFPIPGLLRALLAVGRWPSNQREEMQQNLRSLVPPERVRSFAPEETSIYLLAPPFRTVADVIRGKELGFWTEFGAVHEISPKDSVIIGDFGLGSDAPIILDCRQSSPNPPVMRLRWSVARGKKETSWVRGAAHFDEFIDMLGLAQGLGE